MSSVTIIDYGVGNIASIVNMLKKAGHAANVAAEPAAVRAASSLILPGVGAFDRAAARLESTGMRESILDSAAAGTPILGVCLGMQLLLDGSDEGVLPGLGLIPGRSHRFPTEIEGHRLRVPHMAWNTINRNPAALDALPNVARGDRFYFVHSFYVQPESDDHVMGTSVHGIEFASMVRRGNVMGVQFHPEKSHRYGMRLLNDFALAAGGARNAEVEGAVVE